MTKLLSFFQATLLNVRKEPDGKLVFCFFLSIMVILSFPVYWFWKVSVPDWMYWASISFLAAAFGIDGYVTAKQIGVENPSAPAITIANKADVTNEAA